MPTIISQGLTVPSGLANGQVADASQISPLYNALNNFSLPDSIGAFQLAFDSGTTAYPISTGSSQDWSFDAVAATKVVIATFGYNNTGTTPTFVFRVNGIAVTSALNLQTAGVGMFLIVIGGHDSTVATRSFWAIGIDNAIRTALPSADLSDTDTTSIGVTLGAAGTTANFKYVKVWKQG